MVWTKFIWKKNSWKRLSLIGDETVINLQSTKVYVFSDSVLCLGKVYGYVLSLSRSAGQSVFSLRLLNLLLNSLSIKHCPQLQYTIP